MNHPPTYVRTFSLHKIRENCHFLDHPPTPMSLRNKKMATFIFYKNIHSGSITFANWFELLSFHTNVIQDQKEVSITLSDHEPLILTIYLLKWWLFWSFCQKIAITVQIDKSWSNAISELFKIQFFTACVAVLCCLLTFVYHFITLHSSYLTCVPKITWML